MSYTHKPTNPEDGSADTDRTAYFNHHKIARITRLSKGPGKGLWLWALEFENNTDTRPDSGTIASLNEALSIVKDRHRPFE